MLWLIGRPGYECNVRSSRKWAGQDQNFGGHHGKHTCPSETETDSVSWNHLGLEAIKLCATPLGL